ncbi:MAG: V-type ATP synthase subunit K [Candidatus Hydrogenedens sp.]|nr:V-type ATP synthase subunit K [Candidatus Hydrogenedens sp.]
MVKQSLVKKFVCVCALAFVVMFAAAPMALAQDHGAEAGASSSLGDGIKIAGAAIGAGIALAGAALGTGRAQASIGAGGTGALAEKPELFTNVLILVALPETIVVFGFVIAFLIMGLAG